MTGAGGGGADNFLSSAQPDRDLEDVVGCDVCCERSSPSPPPASSVGDGGGDDNSGGCKDNARCCGYAAANSEEEIRRPLDLLELTPALAQAVISAPALVGDEARPTAVHIRCSVIIL